NNRTYQWQGTMHTRASFLAATSNQYDVNGRAGDNLQFVNIANRDFQLEATSPLVDKGGALTTATSAGATSTTLTVADAGYFHDGWGLIGGDQIKIGGNPPVTIQRIDYGTNTITLAQPQSWASGAGVSLPYNGNAPDMGALESGGGLQ